MRNVFPGKKKENGSSLLDISWMFWWQCYPNKGFDKWGWDGIIYMCTICLYIHDIIYIYLHMHI